MTCPCRASGSTIDIPRFVGGPAVRVEVRLEHGAGEVLEDAVLEDLHAGRPERPPGSGPRRATSSSICSAPWSCSHVERRHDARGQLAAPGERAVGLLVGSSTEASCHCVMPERVQVRLRLGAARRPGPRRCPAGRCRTTSSIALSWSVPAGDPSGSRMITPSCGIGGVGGDPGELERPGVHPRAVAVAAVEVRPVGRGPPRPGSARVGFPPGKSAMYQPSPTIQGSVRMTRRVLAHDLAVVAAPRGRADVALLHARRPTTPGGRARRRSRAGPSGRAASTTRVRGPDQRAASLPRSPTPTIRSPRTAIASVDVRAASSGYTAPPGEHEVGGRVGGQRRARRAARSQPRSRVLAGCGMGAASVIGAPGGRVWGSMPSAAMRRPGGATAGARPQSPPALGGARRVDVQADVVELGPVQPPDDLGDERVAARPPGSARGSRSRQTVRR